MMNYLNLEQLKSILIVGKAIEQWLGYSNEEDYIILKWIRIDPEKGGHFTVSYFESFDEGNIDFVDIYEFSTLDPDVPFGISNTFSTIEEAINFSIKEYNAALDKFVSAGMIQEEYIIYLNSKV